MHRRKVTKMQITTTTRRIGSLGGVRKVAIALAAAGALALPAQAFADGAMPTTPTVPPPFTWNLQLGPNSWEGGVSPDLPSAIVTAEAGVTLTPDQTQALADALTAEAQAEGASMTAVVTTPAPTLTPAQSAAQATPLSLDPGY